MTERGFCECSCGHPTRIARWTDHRHGHVKGEPVRFIRGHSNRGRPPAPEARAKIGAALRGRHLSPEHRAKISSSTKGRPGKRLTLEARAKISAAKKGIPGRPISAAHRARLSAARWGGREPGYGGMHDRVRDALPRECLHCGATKARLEVALRHDGSPSARRRARHGGKEKSYSLKAEDYIRLCHSCHAKYDDHPWQLGKAWPQYAAQISAAKDGGVNNDRRRGRKEVSTQAAPPP